MKRLTLIISTILLQLTYLSAQQSTYVREPGYWTIGINGGAAYQQSDVPSLLKGYGGGLTLAKNLYYQPNAPFSFDLRGRLLYTRSFGLDHSASTGIANNDALNGNETGLDYTIEGGGPGFVYHNHRTDLFELGLEGVLTFNQLRERHNVLLSLYGGFGFDWFNTKIDQRDFNGDDYALAYETLNLNPNRSNSAVRSELRENILDGDYESNAHSFDDAGKLRIMPSLGIELGYLLTPRFYAGIGHRITFTGTDVFDGHQWNNDNTLTGENDWHHYTSLHLRWEIPDGRQKRYAPIITITNPQTNPYSTRNPNAVVKADIKHVNSAVDVTCELNGNPIPFDFFKRNFNTTCLLDPGRNELVITATNEVGHDQKQLILIYQESTINDPDPQRAPEVRITNPQRDGQRVQDDRYTIRATVRNIERRSDIYFLFNGRSSNDFNYDSRTNSFSANVRLQEGRNDIRIEASNSAGADRDESNVFLERYRPEPPSVRITRPNTNPFNTDSDRVRIEATTSRINNARDIDYQVNGRSISNFNFNGNRFSADALLQEGRNRITIRVFNPDGEDQDEVIINYTRVNVNFPRVRITTPDRENSTTTNNRQSIRATVDYVDRKDQIDMYVNGRRSTSFSFNNRTGSIGATVNLRLGVNDVRFVVRNEAGQDEDQVSITYQEDVVIDLQRPPQVTISRPANNSTTESDQIIVQAQLLHVNSRNDIRLTVNGNAVSNFDFNTRSKRLEATVRLRQGSNYISVEGRNRDGSDRDEVRVDYRRSSNPPSVSITRPSSSNSTTDRATAEFEATVRNVDRKSDIQLTLNGRNLSNFDFRNGRVTTTLNLREGSNEVVIAVSNSDGRDQDQATIRYSRLKTPPNVSITRPSSSNSTTDRATAEFEATVRNVDRKSDIQLTLNGRNFSNFNFRNERVTANLNLQEGSNTVVIKVSNPDGRDQDQATIRYSRLKTPPNVSITKPSNSNSTTGQATAAFEATVRNVDRKSDIQLTLNGRNFSNFNFRNEKVTANLNLQEGSNTVVIKVSNPDGRDQDQATIRYSRLKTPPSVSITKPSNSNSITDQAKAPFQAKVRNVESKGDIQLTLNGRNFGNFDFRKGLVTATLNLKEGSNEVIIKVSNKDGRDQDQAIIRYNRKKTPPNVSITRPAASKSNSEQAEVSFRATVKNVNLKEDIQLLLNGKRTNNFKFNSSREEVTATLNLKEGNNEVVIKVSNKDGRDEDSAMILYRPRKNPPTVKITAPNPKGNLTTNKATIEANIANVESKDGIVFTINGKSSKDFSFRKGKFSGPATLKLGKNQIEIKASNKDGSDTDKITLSFRPPLTAKPSVKFTDPARPGKKVTANRYSLQANVSNVKGKDDITFKVNGKVSKSFSYNSRAKKFSATVGLKNGSNSFEIIARNEAGEANAKTTLVLEQKIDLAVKKPKIGSFNISAPVVSPLSPNTAKITVNATLVNISNRNQISFTLNNKTLTDFDFNTRSGQFVGRATLTRGDNILKLKVTNKDGTTEKVEKIVF